MSEFKIEKNIPLPESNFGGKGKSKYPFADMEIGDSFLIKTDTEKGLSRAYAAPGHARSKFPDRKFSARRVKDGVRIFRTK